MDVEDMDNIVTIKTSVKDSVLRYHLFKGTLLSGIGGVLLMISGAFIPSPELSEWGISIFILGLGLITVGLLPYRWIWRLELNPCVLSVDEKHLSLFFKNKRLISIPRADIAHMQYFETRHSYGIRLRLKSVNLHKAPLFNRIRLRPYCKELSNGDLLLLYFSERSFAKLLL